MPFADWSVCVAASTLSPATTGILPIVCGPLRVMFPSTAATFTNVSGMLGVLPICAKARSYPAIGKDEASARALCGYLRHLAVRRCRTHRRIERGPAEAGKRVLIHPGRKRRVVVVAASVNPHELVVSHGHVGVQIRHVLILSLNHPLKSRRARHPMRRPPARPRGS